MNILVVDDNEANVYQVQFLLQASGFEVEVAGNGAIALAKARQSPPDLIISDILMPVMDGFTLCRKWRHDERLRLIPFVFYTATYTDDRDRQFALSLGADKFLIKPQDPEVFLRIIREVIEQVRLAPHVSRPSPEESKEANYLKQYSEVLIRKLEAKMEQLEKANRALEAANRLKTEFLANMSHEIRTPIAAILGYCDLLDDAGLDQAKRRQFLQLVQRNGRALLQLMSDLLDLSLLEAGRLRAEKSECGLQQIIDEVLAVVQLRAEEKGLQLRVIQEPPVVEKIFTDPVRLRQILVNLVANAVKFTPKGEVVLTIQHLAKTGQMRFVVADTGIGMAPDAIANLFQPFWQADTTSTRTFGGAGIGLAIAQRLAKTLGGQVEVTSELGHGSKFSLTIDTAFPVPQPEMSKDQGKPAEKPAH